MPAARAGTLGASGTACALPVTFDLPARWQAKAVPDGLARQGRFTLRCEVDAKPAGAIGFLRVWTGTAGADPAAALREFLAADRRLTDVQQRRVDAGPLPAAETTYLRSGTDSDPKRERVLAVRTAAGPVVVTLSGLDTQEYENMLPAYALLRHSIHATG